MQTPALPSLEPLSRRFPRDRFLDSESHLAAYESDGLTIFRTRPRAIVIPITAEETIETVRFCHEHGIPFVARGSGTSLSGGAVPVRDGIILAMNRLNRVLKLDPVDRIAVVEPGVYNLQVSQAAAAHGLYFAPDPSSQQICTIGGNVAFNSGGAHCLKYGMTSNHVVGLKAVLGTGEVVEFGGASRENVGPDFTGLFVGCEGMFGVALEITLRLLPKVATYHTVLAGYPNVEAAGDAVSRIIASGLLPGALEIMDRLAIDAAEAAVHAGYPKDAEAILIVELEGTPAEVAAEKAQLHPILESSGANPIQVAANDQERMKIWKGRKSAFSAVGRLSPDFIVQDGVVPRSRLGEALRRIGEISRETGVPVANVFHAGDGNLHPLILFDGSIPGAFDRAEAVAARILTLCTDMGGSITGEHGVGMEKRAFLGNMFSEEEIESMKVIRRAFDPKEVANPGKMFPDAEAPAMGLYGLHPLEKQGVISRE